MPVRQKPESFPRLGEFDTRKLLKTAEILWSNLAPKNTQLEKILKQQPVSWVYRPSWSISIFLSSHFWIVKFQCASFEIGMVNPQWCWNQLRSSYSLWVSVDFLRLQKLKKSAAPAMLPVVFYRHRWVKRVGTPRSSSTRPGSMLIRFFHHPTLRFGQEEKENPTSNKDIIIEELFAQNDFKPWISTSEMIKKN